MYPEYPDLFRQHNNKSVSLGYLLKSVKKKGSYSGFKERVLTSLPSEESLAQTKAQRTLSSL